MNTVPFHAISLGCRKYSPEWEALSRLPSGSFDEAPGMPSRSAGAASS